MTCQAFLVRGISILKTKYDTLQALTYRPAWMLERWEAGMRHTVAQMLADWQKYREGDKLAFGLDESEACNAYGGCALRTVCLSNDPEPWLASQFVQREWNPLTRSIENSKCTH